jgi:hypothetical protein
MATIKVLIAVKTYPTLSSKYEELVCTAGFREDGTWIRIYPVPYRKLDYAKQYAKYEWIEIDAVKNKSDFRKESFRPITIDTQPVVLGTIDTIKNDKKIVDWEARKAIVLKNVYTDLNLLIAEAKNPAIKTSLATFKPTKILDFYAKPCEREWDKDKIAELQQGNLFEEKNEGVKIVKKLPFTFHYKFEDINGVQSNLMVEDWEVGALYWNCFKRADGNETIACQKVREKYFDDFAQKKDLYFFLGTSLVNHAKNARNPFMIIGTFQPKIETQFSLF